jgi:hypothetical protein
VNKVLMELIEILYTIVIAGLSLGADGRKVITKALRALKMCYSDKKQQYT